jgi:hypothetical protein
VTQRDRIILGVVAGIAILAGFWFVVLTPKRKEAADLDTQITTQQERLDSANARISAGQAARKGFAEDYATVAKLGKAVPPSDQTPSLVYQLESTAKRHSVDFRTLKLRAQAGGAAAPAAAQAAAAAAAANGTTPAGGQAAPTQAAAATAPPGAAVGPAGFPTLPFTFKFEGDFFRMERMLSAIERFTSTVASGDKVFVNGRLLTVDGFSIGESKLRPFPYIQASVTATAYVLPPDEGAFAGATPSGPAASPSATPAPGGQTADSGGPRPTTATVGGLTP